MSEDGTEELFRVEFNGTVMADGIYDALRKIGMHFLSQGVYEGLELHPDDTVQAHIEVQPKRRRHE